MATIPLLKILIVDDEENYLNSLRRVLQGTYQITTTKDPIQALKIVEHQGPFAVIISDFRMPFINGIELFSRILTFNKQAQRILITGHAELQMTIDAINHGKINAFLTKPATATTIRSVVLGSIHAYQALQPNEACRIKEPPTPVPQNLSEALPIAPLTVKEKEVLLLLAKGHSNAEIAQELRITVGTVKTHLNNLFSKFDVNSRNKLVAMGSELGLIKSLQQ